MAAYSPDTGTTGEDVWRVAGVALLTLHLRRGVRQLHLLQRLPQRGGDLVLHPHHWLDGTTAHATNSRFTERQQTLEC